MHNETQVWSRPRALTLHHAPIICVQLTGVLGNALHQRVQMSWCVLQAQMEIPAAGWEWWCHLGRRRSAWHLEQCVWRMCSFSEHIWQDTCTHHGASLQALRVVDIHSILSLFNTLWNWWRIACLGSLEVLWQDSQPPLFTFLPVSLKGARLSRQIAL